MLVSRVSTTPIVMVPMNLARMVPGMKWISLLSSVKFVLSTTALASRASAVRVRGVLVFSSLGALVTTIVTVLAFRMDTRVESAVNVLVSALNRQLHRLVMGPRLVSRLDVRLLGMSIRLRMSLVCRLVSRLAWWIWNWLSSWDTGEGASLWC